jgi:PAS domain S-box-containing protein
MKKRLKTTKEKRILSYVILFIALFVGYFLLRDSTWQGSKQLHTLMELMASTLAFIVGAMALVRFYSKKDNTFLFIGTGFLGTSFLDTYHTVVTSTFFDMYFPSPSPSLIPWSWIASRLFLSVFLWWSWLAWLREQKRGKAGIIDERIVYVMTGILTIGCFLFFALVPLPHAYYPDIFFHRPEELIPALFFLLALIGYLKKGDWKENGFEHWLVLSLIVGFMGQAMFMSFSGHLFDMMFDAAHLLKKLSYICVLIGLFISMYNMFRQTENSIKKLSKTTILLQKEEFIRGRAELAMQKAKEKAESRERELQAIFDTTPAAIIVINIQGIVESCNHAFEEMFDYAAEEVINHNVKMITTDNIRPHHDSYIRRYLKTDEKRITGIGREVIARRKDGSTFYIHLSVGEFEIAGQRKFAGVMNDISDRKAVEEKYRLAKEEAETANRAKSAFLANMSHELRTPLNGILGYTQILHRDSKLDEKQQDAIHVIHHSGEYLLTLISDILDLSKIEADRIELYPTAFHFNDFLQSIVQIFQMRVQQKEIAFIYEKLSHLPEGVQADEKRLRQVIINLLGNAIKFTQEGGVSFKVGYHNRKIRFQIEDTGVGIAPEDMKHIFQPFKQVGDQNTRAEGTGLGLSITKKLVELMGGQLHVESTLGKGSLFWMALDLPEVTNLERLDKTEEPIIRGFEGKSRKVLIVDDKESNRSVLINLLAPLGFETLEAINGQDCVNKTVEHKPDIILTDLVMPVMDGFEACRRIRRFPECKKTTIIMISASVFECHKEQSVEAGCDDFLPKPIRAEELLKVLKEQLKLTWIYEGKETNDEKNTDIEPETGEFVGPNNKQAAVLLDFAMMGDLDSIVEQLEEFEQADRSLAPFANKIKELAKSFEADQIYNLIEQYVKK